MLFEKKDQTSRKVIAGGILGVGVLAFAFLHEPEPLPKPDCVAKGTRVNTPDGIRRIEDLVVGDSVFSIDPATGLLVPTKVVAIRSGYRRVGAIHVGNRQLLLTRDHPVFDPVTRDYHAAETWFDAGSHGLLMFEGGARQMRMDSAYQPDSWMQVFDITVESELHNFIAEGIVVHNKSFSDPPVIAFLPADVRCDGADDCVNKAVEQYKKGIVLVDKPDAPFDQRSEGFVHLKRAEFFAKKAAESGSSAGLSDLEPRVHALQIEFDNDFKARRVVIHRLKQRKKYDEMALELQKIEADYPYKGSRERQFAEGQEIWLKENGLLKVESTNDNSAP